MSIDSGLPWLKYIGEIEIPEGQLGRWDRLCFWFLPKSNRVMIEAMIDGKVDDALYVDLACISGGLANRYEEDLKDRLTVLSLKADWAAKT